MQILSKPTRFLVFIILLCIALYYGKPVIVPFCFAGLLAMLFLPLSRKLEDSGRSRGVAALICVLIFILFVAGILALLSWQISDLSKDLTGIEQQLTEYVNRVRQYISDQFGISFEQQKQIVKEQQGSGPGASETIGKVVGSFIGVVVDMVLVLVYIFLLLYLRTHLKKFILKLSSPENQEKTSSVLDKSSRVAHQYIKGLSMMIISLWVLYSIGFSVVGVKNAFFFAILCGLLEIIPFVGNITGTTLTIFATLAQGGGSEVVIGILIVYGTIQFVQTYVLEPLVVGAEVNLNPLATIIVIVAGESLWGVSGMVLALPLLGIVKIIFDHVDDLKPYGYLLGQEKKKSSPTLWERIKNIFSKK